MYVVIKTLSMPIIWVLVFLLCGLIFTRNAQNKNAKSFWGWYLCCAAFMILFTLSMPLVRNALVYTLEAQYQPVMKQDLQKLDVVVVLGAGLNAQGDFQKNTEASAITYSRLFNGVEAYKASSAKKFIVVGGSSSSSGYSVSEAQIMKDLALKLAVPLEQIISEIRSRTTRENALELKKLGVITDADTIGLVTSAIHMMRSLWIFKKVFPQNRIIPIPVAYTYEPVHLSIQYFLPNATAFFSSTQVIYEWLGWLFYRSRQ